MSKITTAADVITGQGTQWDVPEEVLRDLEAQGIRPVNGDPCFLVTIPEAENSPAMRDLVGEALAWAASRIGCVTYDGLELESSYDETGEHYTPNMVRGPVQAPFGFIIDADTKAEIPIPMLETMTRVIIEELERADAVAHIEACPKGINPWDYPVWAPSSTEGSE